MFPGEFDKYTKLGGTFLSPGDAGHGGHQFLTLKTTQLNRPFGMDFVKKTGKEAAVESAVNLLLSKRIAIIK